MIAFVVLSVLPPTEMGMFFRKMAGAGVSVNAAMFVFNLIPVPPLDGGRIMTGLLPMQLARPYASIERYSLYVFGALVLLMYTGILNRVLLAAIVCHWHFCHAGHSPDRHIDLMHVNN
jgi:Zn-dependent protease